ncbi:MAG: glutamate racemase [Muribaculum sp.]|nr:glutamate racemase [Muribaculum sp.]
MGPIGVFDSGYGGLTILREMRRLMPQYDYIYLGDNARAPYGVRSFDVVYQFTLQAVKYLFGQGCPLVILACNTASAKALRTIQQVDLPLIDGSRRVLGVIRPTAEAVVTASRNGHVGVFGTPGTIRSHSYDMEIAKLNPAFSTVSQDCPMWVPIVESGEYDSPGADYFVTKYVNQLLEKDSEIDTIILGCTHYPLLYPKIRATVPSDVTLLCQGELVADSLKDYLSRHPEIESRLTRSGGVRYLTSENPSQFDRLATLFLDRRVSAAHAILD